MVTAAEGDEVGPECLKMSSHTQIPLGVCLSLSLRTDFAKLQAERSEF